MSCVTDAVLDVKAGYYPAELPHAATLNKGVPVRLQGESRVSLSLSLHYRIIEDSGSQGLWAVRIAAYYIVLTDENDDELLAYHWHPSGRSGIAWPHLHIRIAGSYLSQLAKAHLPTGRITIPQVLRLAISELAVQPRRHDWAAVLDRAQAALEEQHI